MGEGEGLGYDLLPLYAEFWTRARKGPNETFAVALKPETLSVSVAGKTGRAASRQFKTGSLGVAFRGSVGAANMARPPWGWFDREERGLKAGVWFFDPASTVKRHFNLGDEFSVAYVSAPFVGVYRR